MRPDQLLYIHIGWSTDSLNASDTSIMIGEGILFDTEVL